MDNVVCYDLHSDILTAKRDFKGLIKESVNNQKQGYKSINAIFKGDLLWKNVLDIARKAKQNLLDIAFEDCCYTDFKQEVYGKDFCQEKLLALASELEQLKPLYLSLCWNGKNEFAYGCKEQGGLTEWGKRFIEILNEKNLVLDTAHANEESFYQIVERANKVICSHAAFSFIYPHKRNVSKHQIKQILQKGGIIGIVAVGHFLTGAKGSISAYENAFYEHIDGYLQNFGDRGLCIATDFYGSDAPVFFDGDYSFCDRFRDRLMQNGVTSGAIDNILFKNANAFFAQK